MKITKKIEESGPKKQDDIPNSSFNLSRRIDSPPEYEPQQETDVDPSDTHTTDTPTQPADAPTHNDWEQVAYRLTQLIGEPVLERIRQYPLSQIAYVATDTSLNGWLIEVLRTLMKHDDIQDISHHLDQTVGGTERKLIHFQQTCHDQDVENGRLRSQIEQLQEKIDELDTARTRNNRLLKTRVTIDAVINTVFDPNDSTERSIIETLKNDLATAPDDLGAFTLAFVGAWNELKTAVHNLPTTVDEEQRLTQLSEALRTLLVNLSGLYVTARRGLLNTVAQYASEGLSQYEFVSPEETKLANPTIHRTDALGGSVILEGITFAVLKRDTRQTIRYAEVKVDKI